MPLTLRKNEKDDDTLIGLPYPYTVPCTDGMFNELLHKSRAKKNAPSSFKFNINTSDKGGK